MDTLRHQMIFLNYGPNHWCICADVMSIINSNCDVSSRLNYRVPLLLKMQEPINPVTLKKGDSAETNTEET